MCVNPNLILNIPHVCSLILNVLRCRMTYYVTFPTWHWIFLYQHQSSLVSHIILIFENANAASQLCTLRCLPWKKARYMRKERTELRLSGTIPEQLIWAATHSVHPNFSTASQFCHAKSLEFFNTTINLLKQFWHWTNIWTQFCIPPTQRCVKPAETSNDFTICFEKLRR